VLRWIVVRRGDDDADADAWYEGEEPFGRALVVELRRLRRRAAARPVLTLLLAVVMTGLVVVRIARRPRVHIAHVVIAVSEGTLATGREPIPVRELREYVNSALLPDAKLTKLIEEMDLFPLRSKLGMPFALESLRDMVDITVYRNYFVADTYDPNLRRTARIEITSTYSDDKIAYAIALRIARIIVATSDEIEDTAAAALTRSAEETSQRAHADADALDRAISVKELALRRAEERGDPAAAGLRAELAGLDHELNESRRKLTVIDAAILVDRTEADAMAAGLNLKLEVVAERPPTPEVDRTLRLVLIGIIVLVIMLPVAAVVVGAFDPRIHDTGDVTRLGFASLGHMPAFGGDRIGSLRARGVRRRRAAQY
jgi:hypothetical protein